MSKDALGNYTALFQDASRRYKGVVSRPSDEEISLVSMKVP